MTGSRSPSSKGPYGHGNPSTGAMKQRAWRPLPCAMSTANWTRRWLPPKVMPGRSRTSRDLAASRSTSSASQARSLARLHDGRGMQGGQGRLRRKAHLLRGRRSVKMCRRPASISASCRRAHATSGVHFQQACEMFAAANWQGHQRPHAQRRPRAQGGIGLPPDLGPATRLDWNMGGPRPNAPVHKNRFASIQGFSHFRWFWGLRGGRMTDWGIHWWTSSRWHSRTCQNRLPPGRQPGTMTTGRRDLNYVTYEYPASWRLTEPQLVPNVAVSVGIYFHGTEAPCSSTGACITSSGKRWPPGSDRQGNQQHHNAQGENFLKCVRTRRNRPAPLRTAIAHLDLSARNVAYRAKLRIDWDVDRTSVAVRGAQYLSREYRPAREALGLAGR